MIGWGFKNVKVYFNYLKFYSLKSKNILNNYSRMNRIII